MAARAENGATFFEVPPEEIDASMESAGGVSRRVPCPGVALRDRAKRRGWKLSEYGLFEGEKVIAGRTEEEIYEKLGLAWIPPELRENLGEVGLGLDESAYCPGV